MEDSQKVFLIDFFSLFFSSFIEQDLHQLGPDFNPRTSFLKKKGRHYIYKCTINFIVVLIFWLNICYYFLDYLWFSMAYNNQIFVKNLYRISKKKHLELLGALSITKCTYNKMDSVVCTRYPIWIITKNI